jgi:hypothetical protein
MEALQGRVNLKIVEKSKCRLTNYLGSSQLLVKLGDFANSFNTDALVSGCFKIPNHQNLGRTHIVCHQSKSFYTDCSSNFYNFVSETLKIRCPFSKACRREKLDSNLSRRSNNSSLYIWSFTNESTKRAAKEKLLSLLSSVVCVILPMKSDLNTQEEQREK